MFCFVCFSLSIVSVCLRLAEAEAKLGRVIVELPLFCLDLSWLGDGSVLEVTGYTPGSNLLGWRHVEGVRGKLFSDWPAAPQLSAFLLAV